jgi:hypothetical protein
VPQESLASERVRRERALVPQQEREQQWEWLPLVWRAWQEPRAMRPSDCPPNYRAVEN